MKIDLLASIIEVRWFAPEERDGLPMHHTQRLRVEHALRAGAPYAG
ncbi:hypothetical protein [Nocardiopsis sp. NRRL B-16309]|nr:hypothetical protein [Nocardiopsis sp. NRRL B-16309]